MLWLLPFLALLAFEAIADIFAEEYAIKGGSLFWTLAIVGYILANVFWLSSLKLGSGLARGTTLFGVGSLLIGVILGVIFFHERLDAYQMAGVALGLVSVVLVAFK